IWANSVEGQGTSIFITLPGEVIEDGDWDNNKEHIKSVILSLLVLMSVVLTYMVWNFSPDLANVYNTVSNKSGTKPLTTPMTAKMDTTSTPLQIIHS
ncbi:two-component system activity regulator YycH, partial [Staphylococcus aureus]